MREAPLSPSPPATRPPAAGPGAPAGCPPAAASPPRGVVRLAPAAGRRWRLTLVPVRCRRQPADDPPWYARPRLMLNVNEVAGALGDLGTFLPHVLGVVAVVGLPPAGVLATFGLFYLVTGIRYGIPIGVQPMKAASAAVLIQHLAPGEVAAAGLVIGTLFLLAGWSGLADRLARLTPPFVTAGIQLGLGLSLAVLGFNLIRVRPELGLLVAVPMLLTLGSRRVPAALLGLGIGLAAEALVGRGLVWPELHWGVHLPPLVWPTWREAVRATELAVLPQVPLTLTNAVIVTAALARELFPKEQHGVTVRSLAVSTGLGNLLAAPFGGYLMCHGAGGLAGHYRFGSRSGTAPVLIGALFLVLGIGLGDGATAVMRLVPEAVVGALLFFSGLELAVSARPERFSGVELFVVLLVAAIGVAANPAVGFAAGLLLAAAVRRGWCRLAA